MNYIAQIRAFYDLLPINPLSTGQIALWHALMHINNRCAWIEWFTAANPTLESLSGLTRQAIIKARNVLKQKGYIDFKSRERQASFYKVIDLCMLNSLPKSVPDGVPESVPSSLPDGVPGGCPLNKQNETKQEPITPIVPYEEIRRMYGELCTGYPRLTVLSEARKKAIAARIRCGYSVEDFRRLFEKAQASSFLRGKNNRNWCATFDWLIKDANMAKVLSGNYDDVREVTGDGQPTTALPGAVTV